MVKRPLTLALLAVAASMAWTSSFGQGMPVIDLANVVQAMQTVASLKSQLAQQVSLYRSLNGSRGMGQLLADPRLGPLLPAGWQQLYAAARQGTAAGMDPAAQVIRANTQIFDCETRSGTARDLCAHESNKSPIDASLTMDAYATASRRLDQEEALLHQIDGATDPKAIADLTARLAAESAVIQSEQTKLQLFKMLSDIEDRLIAQQKHELAMRRGAATASASQKLTPVTFP